LQLTEVNTYSFQNRNGARALAGNSIARSGLAGLAN